jgi:hypothetical protein
MVPLAISHLGNDQDGEIEATVEEEASIHKYAQGFQVV